MAQPTSWLSKVLAVVVVALIIAVGYVFKKATDKTDTDNYDKGAVHNEYTISENNILPRCGQMFAIMEKGMPVKAVKK